MMMITATTDTALSPLTRRAALIAAAFALLLGAAAAPAWPQTALSVEDRADLARVEAYLNGLDTVQARFVQVSQNAGISQGTFYLERPGRMRIEYDPPIPYLYVADGVWLTFWDGELEQRSDVPLGSTLADFITRADIRLGGSVTPTAVRRGGGILEVDVVQTEDPGAGLLTLVFTDDPLELMRWMVVDAQGLTTEVTLVEPRFGGTLDRDLFRAPRPPRRRN
ncbi:MAG: outer membrane lipoprotein carrier protein LolA [Inquilinaceae bacterium]